jgi:hypothetical protein
LSPIAAAIIGAEQIEERHRDEICSLGSYTCGAGQIWLDQGNDGLLTFKGLEMDGIMVERPSRIKQFVLYHP